MTSDHQFITGNMFQVLGLPLVGHPAGVSDQECLDMSRGQQLMRLEKVIDAFDMIVRREHCPEHGSIAGNIGRLLPDILVD